MGEAEEKRFRGLGRSTLIIAGIVATLLATSGITFGLLTTSTPVSNTGIIASVNVGIYTTAQCTANLTQISWGTCSPGSNYTRTGYIRNNGNQNMTMTMSTANWNPIAAATSLGISWNYDGRVVRPGQVLAVIWKMVVPSSITGIQNFSFDLVVSGSD